MLNDTQRAVWYWLVGALVLGMPAVSSGQGTVADDRAVLEALYDATNGANWSRNDNWLTSEPLGNWYGVGTDSAGRVTTLTLWDNGLAGSIPAELGNLTNLTYLELGHDELTGSIPAELGNLINLQELFLWNEFGFRSQLTGSIPAELGNLTNLQNLLLSGHQLTGSIPAELGNLTNLQGLWLSTNQLTGSIPAELGSLINLRYLTLYENNLSGPLPSSMTNLRQLVELAIYNNAGLCAPADAAFQAWLATIDDFRGDTCDTTAPTVTISTTAEAPVIGPFTITVVFSEPVSGFELADLVVGNGSASELQGSEATYTATVTPSASGTVTVDIAAGAAADGAGNPSAAAEQFSITAGTAAPTVTGVYIISSPSSGDTFGPGEQVNATVAFSKPVVVTGDPRLVLQMGDQARSADLFFVSAYLAVFRYFVKASDRDDDGIGIPANAVRLNGGSIRDSGGNDVDLTHEAVPDDPRFKVNGGLDAVPTITQVFQGNRPAQDETFGGGEFFSVGVQFSEPVYVTGTGSLQLTVQVGTETRQAEFHRRGTNSILYFEYVVLPSDVDADGYSVPADALTLNGGSVKDADGNDADLRHDAVPADPTRKVNGGSGAPTVRRVLFSRLPASQDTFAAGESIFAVAAFTRDVQVTGTPQFTLQVGAQARRADHLPLLRAAELLPRVNNYHIPEDSLFVYFRYIVQPSDLDDNGISAPANALSLNGGSIRAMDDNSDARVSHDALADDPRRRVDGSRVDDQPPAVRAVFVERPLRGVFGAGDTITVKLAMSEGLTVTGAPRFALRIGAQTRFATFQESLGTSTMLFDYVVDESDRDDNGFSIAADAVDLNGATIRDNAGNDANLDLGYFAFSDDPDYKVDGRLTPVPALPLGGVLALLFALLGGGWRRLTRQPK